MTQVNLEPEALRRDFIRQLARYWPGQEDRIKALASRRSEMKTWPPPPGPPRLELVELPDWGWDLGRDGFMPAPAFLRPEPGDWSAVDWPLVGAWLLHNLAERAHEAAHGPIHSYSFRLRGWPELLWERAWVNRLALFLRRWAAVTAGRKEEELFGPRPRAEIILTHDVDALAKTWAIRLKQGAFHWLNAARLGLRGRWSEAGRRLGEVFKFITGPGGDWSFENMAALDEAYGLKACFLFAATPIGRRPGLVRRLFDPAYDGATLGLRLARLTSAGHTIGAHPSFQHWAQAEDLAETRRRLGVALGQPEAVTVCRQHWLRFSFARTWSAQRRAGFTADYTLGFNDRPGFRNSAALAWAPLDNDLNHGEPDVFRAWPMILMDSHLYDYNLEGPVEPPFPVMEELIKEVQAVGGQATVLWHPHTLSRDYGWRPGLEAFLKLLEPKKIDKSPAI